MTPERRSWLMEVFGTSLLQKTANKLASVLGKLKIPHLVAGGYAVQEYGYHRMTGDVDFIVPNPEEVREQLSIRGFVEVPGTKRKMKDRETKVEVDLLPGGGKVGPSDINFPQPTEVSETPKFVSLSQLISNKLDVWLHSKVSRAKDLGDVVELIKANKLTADFDVDDKVKAEYQRICRDVNNSTEVES